MTKTAKQLIEESRALRLSFKPVERVAIPDPLEQPKFTALPFVYMHYQVLAFPDFSWCDIVINLYTTDGPVGNYESVPNTTVLVHNHTRDERCYSKHKCFVLGFEGGQNDNQDHIQD